MNNNRTKIPKLKKRFVTLIEIMIVMFLIALITGVVAYNYRGTLEEGKAFKTKTGIQKLETILSLAVADHPDVDLSDGRWQDFVKSSPLVSNYSALIKDGWGEDYHVDYDPSSHAIKVTSRKYDAYVGANKTSMFRDKD